MTTRERNARLVAAIDEVLRLNTRQIRLTQELARGFYRRAARLQEIKADAQRWRCDPERYEANIKALQSVRPGR